MTSRDPMARLARLEDWVRQLAQRVDPAFTPQGTIRQEVVEGQLPEHTHEATGEGGPTVKPSNLRLRAGGTLTIASGVVTVTRSEHAVDTEGAGASDDLTTINGLNAGQLYLLRPADGGRTVVVKHGSGNILCVNNGDLTLDDVHDFVLLFSPDGVNVFAIGDTQGAGGSHEHTTGDGTGPLTNDEHDGYMELAEIAAPSTPAANKLRLYAKDSGGVSALFFLQDDGTEVEVGAGGGSVSMAQVWALSQGA